MVRHHETSAYYVLLFYLPRLNEKSIGLAIETMDTDKVRFKYVLYTLYAYVRVFVARFISNILNESSI